MKGEKIVKVLLVKCPECGATLHIEEDRARAFCTYCGAKVLLENENEHVYRHIDDAKIIQAETAHLVKLRQMEMAEKQQIANQKILKLKIIISLILATIGILMLVFGYIAGSSTGDPDSAYYMIAFIGFFPLMGVAYIWLMSAVDFKKKEDIVVDDGRIRLPSSVDDFETKSYVAMEAILKGAGFTNVRCIPLNDLSIGFFTKPGMVESITINGEEATSGRYYPDDSIVISYHSLSK